MVSGEGSSGFGPSKQAPILTRQLEPKVKNWASVANGEQPLQLLDLPEDILQAIVQQVTHTNDLTSLALAHSTLHALVIPYIYSRFDIVWPDVSGAVDGRFGVDALTYGLATLVMTQDVFGEPPPHQQDKDQVHKRSNCGKSDRCSYPALSRRSPRIRRGNHFAQFTRKFSLGSGPPEWVQDYAITREAGKMLGTLVAIAVGRMRNLEHFVWDMPTGVLRDVWLALASLADRVDGGNCRLERVWVRWHDNSDQEHLPPSHQSGNPTLLSAGPTSPSNTHYPSFKIPPYPRVEFPTLSVLPPLKSLSVLDIDELSYTEEMSVLLDTSISTLQELRVGVAQHAQFSPWVRPLEDRNYVTAPTGFPVSSDQISRPGGILGILASRICSPSKSDRSSGRSASGQVAAGPQGMDNNGLVDQATLSNHIEAVMGAAMQAHDSETPFRVEDFDNIIAIMNHTRLGDGVDDSDQVKLSNTIKLPEIPIQNHSSHDGTDGHPDEVAEPEKEGFHTHRLHLEILELERVPLSVAVLSKAMDWSKLVTLTILGCRNHEALWKALRKRFAPPTNTRCSRPTSLSLKTPSKLTPGLGVPHTSAVNSSDSPAISTASYALQIRHIHTDTVSTSFLNFLHTALAPDSITTLILQESSIYKSTVTIDSIYKFGIRRHRNSLRKLLIDSSLRPATNTEEASPDTNWHKWRLHRDLLTVITSGKMHLRELSMSIGHTDWHFFLQRLPNAKELRCLHVMHTAPHPHAPAHVGRVRETGKDAIEAAMQVLDVVALRPELELCYLAIGEMCFEVLERDAWSAKEKGKGLATSDTDTVGPHFPEGPGTDESENEDESVGATQNTAGQQGLVQNEDEEEEQSEEDSDMDVEQLDEIEEATDDDDNDSVQNGRDKRTKTFRLRKILFYDDKITIFKARHGKL